MPLENGLEGGQEVEALLLEGSDVAAEAAEDAYFDIGAEATGDLLLHFHHAQVPLGLVVVKGKVEPVHEAHDLRGEHLVRTGKPDVERALRGVDAEQVRDRVAESFIGEPLVGMEIGRQPLDPEAVLDRLGDALWKRTGGGALAVGATLPEGLVLGHLQRQRRQIVDPSAALRARLWRRS